jgi:hypothetical protein
MMIALLATHSTNDTSQLPNRYFLTLKTSCLKEHEVQASD